MKKLRKNMDRFFENMDVRWQALPIQKQRKYTLYFFVGYLLLTAGVIYKVCYDAGKPNDNMVVRHIENPVLKRNNSPAIWQDTVSTILKNQIYERK